MYYRWQASLYQHGTGLSPTLFLYWNRDSCQMASFAYQKEEKLVEKAYAKAGVIWEGVESECLPKKGSCASITSERAKGCPFKERCFVSKNPLGPPCAEISDPWTTGKMIE